MQTQTIEFTVVTNNGVVKQIGKSSILTPRINYSGKGTKWYKDQTRKGQRKYEKIHS